MIITALTAVNLTAFVMTRKDSTYRFDDFVLTECYMAIGAVIGAKLLYILTAIRFIDFSKLTDPEYLKNLLNGGFVFYGGLLAAVLFAFLAKRIHNIDVSRYLNHFAFLIPAGHGFGRIGCFLAGCCYGCPYNGPFAVTFPQESFAPAGIPLFPVQLLEAGLLFITSLSLYYLYIRKGGKHALALYLFIYSVIRFFTEFLRWDDYRGHILFLSTSQAVSLVLFKTVSAYFIIIHHRGRKKA